MPSTLVWEAFAELIPITSPSVLTKAPPLLPGFIAASVWIALYFTPSIFNTLFSAEIIPTVAVLPWPNALPIAITVWPTSILSESPSLAVFTLSIPADFKSDFDTEITARSDVASFPTNLALICSLPVIEIVTEFAESTTWLFVKIYTLLSSCEYIIPEPEPSSSTVWLNILEAVTFIEIFTTEFSTLLTVFEIFCSDEA